ncbi:mitochondrial ribonuclease P protein 1-like [Scleropages formosus]|uniref:tRNA methyltransferase 10 homolog C n=1 Tax=Scleropages formosus TaxID=113540 RepID=A0A0P7VHI9_SCLFO|nr:mitochondrial ribonuclease P protein 1-like [Scleropages formosus]
MRFFKPQFMNVLRSLCFPQTAVQTGKQPTWLQSNLYPYLPCHKQMLCTTLQLRKEATQTSDLASEKLDLDIWKSVMKSPQLQEEGKEQEFGDPDEEMAEPTQLEAIRDLVEMWRLAGKLVPEQMSDEELEALGKLETKSSKKKYLKYLALKERHKKAEMEKKERKRSQKAAEVDKKQNAEVEDEEDDCSNRFQNKTFLLKFWTRSMDTVHNWRAAQAMCFGQPLVFDMSYEQIMSRQEMGSAISQLLESEGCNRRSTDPFHLHFCSLQPEGSYHRELRKRYGPTQWDRLLVTATSQHYMDLFPRDQLVYLTADSRNVLKTFDHNKVYIVGSIVDKCVHTGLSLASAKRLQLATARLPLDNFLHWDVGSKNLTLDQMMRILLTLKNGGTWEEALEFVPKRKHEGLIKMQRSGKPTVPGVSDRQRTFARKEKAQNTSAMGGKHPGQQKVVTLLNTRRIQVNDVRPRRTKSWWKEE